MVCARRQLGLVGAVIKRLRLLAGVGGDLVDIHPGPGRPEDRLGHEGGEQSAALGDRLDRVLEGHQLVRTLERVAEWQGPVPPATPDPLAARPPPLAPGVPPPSVLVPPLRCPPPPARLIP